MRFLVDMSTGTSVTRFLRGAGHDVVAVAEYQPDADDESILARAHAEDRIVVTNDKDFGDLVYRGGKPHRGVLLLRLQDESAASRVRVVRAAVEQYGDRFEGHFSVATEGRVRVRSPIT